MSFLEPISEVVWDIKYRYRHYHKIIDHSIEDTWSRVARAVSKAEKSPDRKRWEKDFYSILENFKFLPGGRILAGAGTKHSVTLFNCFVMPVSDSLNGIFESLKEGALTLQQGGGIGYDFSTLRPRGYPVEHVGSIASGPVSFMRIWNAMCATMVSTGARRGAMMGVLRCDHPDIEEFIAAKADPKELRHFNVSVLISDDFMQAVKNNSEWSLVFPLFESEKDQLNQKLPGLSSDEIIYKKFSGSEKIVPCRVVTKIKARELWKKIIRFAYDYAEPGVLFENTINRLNNLYYREYITATNPCGEIPLPIYGACNLGAINLTQFVRDPFSEAADFDWNAIERTTQIATRFLDNVIDISRYPLKMQKAEALGTRRIGLGVTGLANVLVMMNMHYGDKKSLDFASQLMRIISETTWKTSAELAEERGSFIYFDEDKYTQSEFFKTLPEDIKNMTSNLGMRNSHHNTIAPTGTISLLANNIANGLEPIFSGHYERSVRSSTGEVVKFAVEDYTLKLWKSKVPSCALPNCWSDVSTITPQDHLKMQAAVQPYIDNAISKTINIPVDFPFEKLLDVYTKAYELGLKGCTIFRPNPTTGSVLQQHKPTEDVDRCCQFD